MQHNICVFAVKKRSCSLFMDGECSVSAYENSDWELRSSDFLETTLNLINLLCSLFSLLLFSPSSSLFNVCISSLSFVSFTSCLADSQLVCSALSFSSSGYKSSCPPFYRVVSSPLSPSPRFSLPFAPTFMTLCSRL